MNGDVGLGIRHRQRLRVDARGRLSIPARLRKAMDIQAHGTVLAWLEDGELRVVTTKTAARQAQELAGRLISNSDKLADELIADRREEARREDDED